MFKWLSNYFTENYLSSLKQHLAAKSTPVVVRSLMLFGFWAPSALVCSCFYPPQTPLKRSTENLQFMSGHPARLDAAKYQHQVLWEKLSYLSFSLTLQWCCLKGYTVWISISILLGKNNLEVKMWGSEVIWTFYGDLTFFTMILIVFSYLVRAFIFLEWALTVFSAVITVQKRRRIDYKQLHILLLCGGPQWFSVLCTQGLFLVRIEVICETRLNPGRLHAKQQPPLCTLAPALNILHF